MLPRRRHRPSAFARNTATARALVHISAFAATTYDVRTRRTEWPGSALSPVDRAKTQQNSEILVYTDPVAIALFR
jgi:hypothetical protein